MQQLSIKALARAQAVSLTDRTRQLRQLADWRDALHTRIADVVDRFERVGVNDAEYDALIAEVHDFKFACRGARP